MMIIYSSYYGSYLAVVAASLHLGKIKAGQFKDEEILKLPRFNSIKYRELGELFYMGTDDRGRRIYVMGSKSTGRVIERTLNGLAEIYGLGKNTVDFVDLNAHSNFYISLGSCLIHKFRLEKTGLALVLKGIRKSMNGLENTVLKVKNEPDYTKKG
jgi:hypothetical protein